MAGTETLSTTSPLEFCRAYQDFLRKSALIAAQEQKLIGTNVKKVEVITSRALECVAGRVAEMKRLENRFRDGEIQATLRKVID